MSKLILFISLLLVSHAASAVSNSEIISENSWLEGIYHIKSGDTKKCSAGRVMWIDDKERDELALQIGARLIIIGINQEEVSEKGKDCKFLTKTTFVDGSITSTSEDKCKDRNYHRKIELSYDKSSLNYKFYIKNKSSEDFKLDHECVLEKRLEKK